jgi:hypothetical protein
MAAGATACPRSLGRLTKRGTRPLQSRDVEASTRQRPRRDRVPNRRHRGLHPRFFGHRRGLLGICRCLLGAWLVRQGRRPSSSRGRLVGAGAGDEHLLVPVPPLGKNRAGRACGLCNASDLFSPRRRVATVAKALRESPRRNSPRPPQLGLSGLTFVAVSRPASYCAYRSGCWAKAAAQVSEQK